MNKKRKEDQIGEIVGRHKKCKKYRNFIWKAEMRNVTLHQFILKLKDTDKIYSQILRDICLRYINVGKNMGKLKLSSIKQYKTSCVSVGVYFGILVAG